MTQFSHCLMTPIPESHKLMDKLPHGSWPLNLMISELLCLVTSYSRFRTSRHHVLMTFCLMTSWPLGPLTSKHHDLITAWPQCLKTTLILDLLASWPLGACPHTHSVQNSWPHDIMTSWPHDSWPPDLVVLWTYNICIVLWMARFLRAICSNHEQITHIALF